MKIRIRILQKEDAPAYREVRLKSYCESPLSFSESYEDECQKTKEDFATEMMPIGKPAEKFTLGAFIDSTLVGFVTFKRDSRQKARHKAMIHGMYVCPEQRGNQIGKRLILELFKLIKEYKGLEQVHLWVLHAEKSASGFYTKLGFVSNGIKIENDLKVGDEYVHAEFFSLYFKDTKGFNENIKNEKQAIPLGSGCI